MGMLQLHRAFRENEMSSLKITCPEQVVKKWLFSVPLLKRSRVVEGHSQVSLRTTVQQPPSPRHLSLLF